VALAAVIAALRLMATDNDWGAEEWFRVLFVVTFEALSVGVATWLGGDDTATATLRRADDAMYEAKRLGGDRLVVWQPSWERIPGRVAVAR
jgi:GGDEF domain-containing protein